MRCARCDQIVQPQVLARAPDGRLVFGWCVACLADEGCVPVDTPAAPLTVRSREPLLRRLRRRIRSARRTFHHLRSIDSGRRLAAMGIAGMMVTWALILAFVGGWRLVGPNSSNGPWLLVVSGAMAITSLIVWISLIGRSGGVAMILKLIHVAGAVVAFGALLLAVLRPRRENAAAAVMVSGAALVVSWVARAMERRRGSVGETHPAKTI